MFTKVLVANRGEIARRIVRTLKALGVKSVAVYSDSDAQAPHVREADEAIYIGPDPATESYLNVEAVIAAAKESGAEAVHPGYGFLAESQEFATKLAEAEITFIGPAVEAISIMGDKARSRDHVSEHGVPVVPGFELSDIEEAALSEKVAEIGFPVLIKPSAGGGGKGMEVVTEEAELQGAIDGAKRVAAAAFGDDKLVIERLLTAPRHIEVQIFGDKHGRVIALGERECTLQRRHQKVIEESPAVGISEELRKNLFEAAVAAAKSVSYTGAGTVEFLVDALNPEEFFFIEMNTRLQVEHPVTEAVTGIDLVEAQLRIAAGDMLSDALPVNGHAVEARIYAEDTEAGFLPSTGKILKLSFGDGVRVDSAVEEGSEISTYYDPMIAKVIARADTREEALDLLDKALSETVILGVKTNVSFLRTLLANERVRSGNMETGLIESLLPLPLTEPSSEMLAAAADLFRADHKEQLLAAEKDSKVFGTAWRALPGWRLSGVGKHGTTVLLRDDSGKLHEAELGDQRLPARAGFAAARDEETVWVSESGAVASFEIVSRRNATLQNLTGPENGAGNPAAEAPMPGAVASVSVSDGAEVSAGDTLLTVEAMKMEHPVKAEVSGIVTIKVQVGDQVQKGEILATIETLTKED